MSMSLVQLRKYYACGAAAAAIAAAAFAAPAMAGSTTLTVDEVNVLDLLSPFLSLNSTTIGQNTLSANLTQAIATNNAASQSTVIEAELISEKTIFSANTGNPATQTSITLQNGTASYYGPGANLAGGLPQQALQSGQSFSSSGNGNLNVTTPVAGTINAYQAVGGLGNLGGAYQTAVSPFTTTPVAGTTNYVLSTSTSVNTALTGTYNTQNVVNLLTNAYAFNSTDLGVAKYYFANGTANGTSNAVAPTGYTLPTYTYTANGQTVTLPNLTTSVYDTAYGVNNTQSQQNEYGDSRPVQVAPNSMVQYDPNAITGLTGNPAFPSGHTTYAFTDSILIGMLTPQYFQSMLLSASEYGNSRIDLGVHYPLDIIASRSFVQYNLMELLTAANPVYTTSTVQGTTGQNLNAQFVSAAQSLTGYLGNYITTNSATLGCNSLANCASNNAYNTYSAQTYAYQAAAQGVTNASTSATDSAIYQYRLTYGLPTYSYAQAERELTDTQGNTAAILLATLYGGSDNQQAKNLANAVTGGTTGAGIYGSLSTATINEIIYNTEGQALQAFYGTQLSYWSRIDLYDAAAYFSNVQGTIQLASTDIVNTNVTITGTVGNPGVLAGAGTVNGNVEAQAGGTIQPGNAGTTSPKAAIGTTGQTLTVNGNVQFDAGSQFITTGHVNNAGGAVTANADQLAINGNLTVNTSTTNPTNVTLEGIFIPGVAYRLITATGAINQTFAGVNFDNAWFSTSLNSYLNPSLSIQNDPAVVLTVTANFAAAAKTPNQSAVATAIDTFVNTNTPTGNGITLLAGLIANNTATTAPAAFNSLGGEGLTGQQQTALNAGNVFVSTVLGQVTYWDGRENNIFGLKDGPACSLKDGSDCALVARGRFWASGFGEYASLDGQASTGSASLTSRNSGVATGADYELTRNLIGGIAAGYSNSNFTVSDRATTGSLEGGHFAVYGVAHYGDFYAASTTSYANYENTTDRSVTALGGVETERGRFSSDEWISSYEAGYKYRTPNWNVTPFVGAQFAQLSNDAFNEASTGVAGLHVDAQTVDSEKTFVGVQFDTKTSLYNGWLLTPYARLSWEHEFSTDRRDTAYFLSLPGSAFTIDGASAAADAARLNAGFKLDVSPNVAVFASFDGEFSARGDIYAGTGGIKIRW